MDPLSVDFWESISFCANDISHSIDAFDADEFISNFIPLSTDDTQYENNQSFFSIEDLHAKQRSVEFNRCEKIFHSIFEFNRVVDNQSREETDKEIRLFRKKGYYYFSTDKIFYDTDKKKWIPEKKNGDIYVRFNIVDKLKVCSVSFLTEYVDFVYATSESSLRRIDTPNSLFLHEVGGVKNPFGTYSRYKTVTTSMLPLACAGYHEGGGNKVKYFDDIEINTINVNLCRGIYELINFSRIVAKYKLYCSGGLGRVILLLPRIRVFNTSTTVDSIISSVQNEATFTANCLWNEQTGKMDSPMRILQKGSFPSYKVVEIINSHPHDKTQSMTYRKRTNSPLIDAIEFQVHERSLNSSAIDGVRAKHVLKNFFCRLLDPNISNGAHVDIFSANCKSHVELLGRSLIPKPLNYLISFAAWIVESRKLSYADQMKLFHSFKSGVLDRLFVSRNSYPQCGTFSIHPLTGRLLDKEDCELASLKYNHEDTEVVFGLDVENMTNIIRRHPLGRSLYLGSFSKGNKRKSIPTRKLCTKKRRTSGIVSNCVFGTKHFIKNFSLQFPTIEEM